MWAATDKAEQELGWRPNLGVAEMCRDQWAWATRYPRGFETPGETAPVALSGGSAGAAAAPEAADGGLAPEGAGGAAGEAAGKGCGARGCGGASAVGREEAAIAAVPAPAASS